MNSTSFLSDTTASSLPGRTQPLQNPYKLLYSYRLSRSDLRGAASALYDRLQLLRSTRDGNSSYGVSIGGNDALDKEIEEAYLSLLNLLSLMEGEEAWILVRDQAKQGSLVDGSGVSSGGNGGEMLKLGTARVKALEQHQHQHQQQQQKNTGASKRETSQGKEKEKKAATLPIRHVVTLADVRRAWQEELDKRADVRAGRVPLFGKGKTGRGKMRSGDNGANGASRTVGIRNGSGNGITDVDVAMGGDGDVFV